MNPLLALPPWAALAVALLALASALLTLIGCIGLLRLKQFYQRVHAPTLGTTLSLYLMLAATMLFFFLDQGRPVLHVLLIAACVIVTTPITLMLLVRAALAREHKHNTAGVTPVAPIDTGNDKHEPGSE